jgi:hypothetical protein
MPSWVSDWHDHQDGGHLLSLRATSQAEFRSNFEKRLCNFHLFHPRVMVRGRLVGRDRKIVDCNLETCHSSDHSHVLQADGMSHSTLISCGQAFQFGNREEATIVHHDVVNLVALILSEATSPIALAPLATPYLTPKSLQGMNNH